MSLVSLNILIADDNPSDRLLLKAMLSGLGHNVDVAEDGLEAIEKFDPDSTQLVCLDVVMPECDGLEAAIKIQEMSRGRFIPIVFLSGLSDTSSLVNCLKVGGSDFISKPYNLVLIAAKLDAIIRILSLQKKLEAQRDKLSSYNEQLIHEQEVAKVVYENITHSNCLSDPCLNTFFYGHHLFNGDVILAAYKPNGGMHLLIGDFTGHGLSAAIGALPLADIFFEWTRKGFLMRQIVPEINRRLKAILPADMFCSALFVDINITDKTLEVWNGGLPDAFFFSQKQKKPQPLVSHNLPLGIVSESEFTYSTEIVSFEEGDSFLAWSDGIYEALDSKGMMFSEYQLNPLVEGRVDTDNLLPWLRRKLETEGVLDSSHDDISCLKIDLSESIGVEQESSVAKPEELDSPSDFSFEYTLNAESLKNTDPLPYILQIIMTVSGLKHYSGQVFMMLSELYSNALEHGVLQLNSKLKETNDGFVLYYMERETRLSMLESGFIKIKVSISSNEMGGILMIELEDSGSGFDTSQVKLKLEDSDELYNRGLPLLGQLCESINFSEKGNLVGVKYQWDK